MVEMTKSNGVINNGKSSKGNQYKWKDGNVWYKADLNGYEGLTECVVSKLLEKSNLKSDEYVRYEPETIKYGFKTYLGCKSENFLESGDSLTK